MAQSPHLYLVASIDLQRAAGWLADTNARRGAPDRVLMAALFLKSVACALRDVPELNGSCSRSILASSSRGGPAPLSFRCCGTRSDAA